MLFNSPAFLFGFLPLALLAFFVAARFSQQAALASLTCASLFFYGWWNPAWLPLLLASMAFNFSIGRALADGVERARPALCLSSRALLLLAITVDLALLLHYKYFDFLAGALAPWLGLPPAVPGGELPLGISFFTFTQIAFVVDAYQGRASDANAWRYGLFVTYYPHLIAGPILHHQEMMPQFARPDIFRFDAGRLADGLVVFTLGLFKKTVLADRFATFVGPAFEAARSGDLSFFESWGAALSYTLQLYFDFSGYSDMAIGLALMVGVRLPLNFNSPYKALDIADFWRRWHMTLSRFLRDYLYIPLGGNRNGEWRRQVNLMTTMLLGGLWHGAGWTFLVWGGLHGAYLVLHRLWRALLRRMDGRAEKKGLPAGLAWLLTFGAVVVAWVFFRAADLPTAWRLLRGMLGLNGSLLPAQIVAAVPALGHLALPAGKVPYLGDGSVMGAVEQAVMIVLGLSIVVLAPAMHRLSNRTRYLLLLPCAALALQRVLFGSASEFLYFQF